MWRYIHAVRCSLKILNYSTAPMKGDIIFFQSSFQKQLIGKSNEKMLIFNRSLNTCTFTYLSNKTFVSMGIFSSIPRSLIDTLSSTIFCQVCMEHLQLFHPSTLLLPFLSRSVVRSNSQQVIHHGKIWFRMWDYRRFESNERFLLFWVCTCMHMLFLF